MFRQFLANFTWIDICIFVIISHACWIGFRKGTLTEVFKIAALFFAVFIGLHFYLRGGNFLSVLMRVPKPVGHAMAYTIFIGMTIGVFRIIRDGMTILLTEKDDGVSVQSRIAGLMLGALRAVLLSSVIVCGCVITGNGWIERSVRYSYSGRMFLPIAPKIYSEIYRVVVSPVFPKEEKNIAAMALAEKAGRPSE